MRGPVGRFRNNVVEIVSTLVTGIWMAGLFTGQDWWLGALIVGYVAVVPITKMLAGEEIADETERPSYHEPEREEPEKESTDEALATLRERYASGELTDEQFERKVERLLEVETVEDASGDSERSRPTDRAVEAHTGADRRRREREYE